MTGTEATDTSDATALTMTGIAPPLLADDEQRRQFGRRGPGIARPELEERTVVESRSWAAR
jgi:hypothetical protein